MSSATHLDPPLVSIGVPVYNEARFLDQSLTSLLAQDYPKIEIILSDNASTDGTGAICTRAAENDTRIRVLHASVNEGATANFQRCLDAAQGKLFMWAGGHDLWSANLVSLCVESLIHHPAAVIAIPESQWIDPLSQPYGHRASILDTRGMDPLARIFMLLWANMHAMYGLTRTSALRATGPIPNYSGADLILLLRMVLQGDFVPAPGALWSRRETRMGEDFRTRQQRYHSSEFGIRKPGVDRLFPVARLPYEILKAVWLSGLSAGDKIAFSLALPAQLPARYLVAKRRAS
ncbi:MAG: glycosyltransferase family 2 protein [Stenotrophobium sp.]